MTKLTLKHVSALSQAEQYIVPAIKNNMERHHRQHIEDVLMRLSELRRWALKAIYEPGLPVQTDIPSEPDLTKD